MATRMFHPTPVFVKSKSNIPTFYKEPQKYSLPDQTPYWKPPVDNIAVQFCVESNLHGLRHIGETNRHICERLLWTATFALSIVAAGLLIAGIWEEYKQTPIETVFTAREIGIEDIPFPSITICNANNIRKSFFDSHMRNLTENMKDASLNYSEDTEVLKLLAAFSDMYHVCETGSSFVSEFKTEFRHIFQNVTNLLSTYRKYYRQYNRRKTTLVKGSQSCDELLVKCIWEGEAVSCRDIFDPFITDYGYCCTFNSMPVSLLRRGSKKPEYEDNLEDWISADLSAANLVSTDKTRYRKVPRTQKISGRSEGLSVLLHGDLEQYVCSNTDSTGFIMGAHLPIDYPKLRDTGLAIATGQETFIGLHPKITIVEDAVSRFSLEDRQCYYGNEQMLAYYTKYTKNNCVSECIARLTLERCKCLRYYMPHKKVQYNSTICDVEHFKCPQNVERSIGKWKQCKECLPTCTDIKYQKEVTSLKLQEERLRYLFTNTNQSRYQNETNQMSIVHVYFNVDSVQPRIRKQVTSIVKLLSSAGGLLGLCMGFSVLSLLEIVYFFTIRLYFAFFEKRRKQMFPTCHVTYP